MNTFFEQMMKKTNILPEEIPDGSILGINYSGMHDTAIALVTPTGRPFFAISLERITRVKKDGRSPETLLQSIPWEKISKVAISVEQEYVPADEHVSEIHPTVLMNPIVIDRHHGSPFLEALSFIPVEKVFVPHHLCHAASAFYGSGFSKATCLVYDGGMSNENWFGGVYEASSTGGVAPVDLFSARNYSNVAHLYTAITVALGFAPLKHEGKITGLAAFGKPNRDCRELLENWFLRPEQLHGVVHWKNMYSQDTPPNLAPVSSALRPIRDALEPYSREDIAATLQALSEEHVSEILQNIQCKTGPIENMCLSGGLFSNVKINQLVSQIGCKRLFVSPPMTDDGTALGAALQIASSNRKFNPESLHTMCLGPQYAGDAIKEVLTTHSIHVTKPKNPATKIASMLADGALVAVFQGAMEFGPRALGNRSILADTSDPDINDRLNEKLGRTEFMPFAPISQVEDAEQLYIDVDRIAHSAEFMTVAVDCHDTMKELCPAVVHCDGTARPQLVSRESNQLIYDILEKYKEKTGRPALVNTSFNIHEEPIVCTPEDALRGFFESGLDVLYLDGQILKLSENRDAEVKFLRAKMQKINSAQIARKHIIEDLNAKLDEKNLILVERNAALAEQVAQKESLQCTLDETEVSMSQMRLSTRQAESNLQDSVQQCRQLEAQLQAVQTEVSQRDGMLREKDVRHQELLLAQIEKETKLQELTTRLRDDERQSYILQAELSDRKEKIQALEANHQDTVRQCQQLEAQLLTLQAEALRRDEMLREKDVRHQELLLAQIERETRLQDISATVADYKRQTDKLHETLIEEQDRHRELAASLKSAAEQRQQLELKNLSLQTDATQHKKNVQGKDETIAHLNTELDTARQQIEELHQSNHYWWSVAEQQKKDLEGASTRIEEFENLSRNCRFETERLQVELLSVYGSKSWRLTWPLRKIMQFSKWLLSVPSRFCRKSSHSLPVTTEGNKTKCENELSTPCPSSDKNTNVSCEESVDLGELLSEDAVSRVAKIIKDREK